MMKSLGGIALVVVLAACSQADEQGNDDKAAICQAIEGDITSLQKRYSAAFAGIVEAGMRNAAGGAGLDRDEVRVRGHYAALRFESELTNHLLLMQGQGCQMPTAIERQPYSQAATNCAQARSSELSGAREACDQALWRVNVSPQEALQNSVLAEDSPSPPESDAGE